MPVGEAEMGGTSILEHDSPITDFGAYSMECKTGGHNKPKLRDSRDKERKKRTWQAWNPRCHIHPLALISLKEASLGEFHTHHIYHITSTRSSGAKALNKILLQASELSCSLLYFLPA